MLTFFCTCEWGLKDMVIMKMTMANENIIQIKFAFFPLIQVFSEELWSREQNQSGGKVLVRGGARAYLDWTMSEDKSQSECLFVE